MNKKLYIKVYTKTQKDLDRLLFVIFNSIIEIPGIYRVTGRVGLLGDEKETNK